MTTRFPPPAQAATLTRISSLDAVPKELFDKVWKLVLECGEQERHFGNLQGIYRGLASTWLLAMFAGVGFLLKENPSQKWMWMFFVGLATSIGIFMLWMLDILVYHRLLLAVFHDGKELERACPWLPPSRNRMKSIVMKDAVRKAVALVYACLILAAAVVTVTGAFGWEGYCGLALATTLVLSLLFLIIYLTLQMSIPSADEPDSSGSPLRPE